MKKILTIFITFLLLTLSSNTLFSQQIEILSPNGGETLYSNRNYEIKWKRSGVGNILINFSIDEGFSWSPVTFISNSTDSSYIWQVPEAPTTKGIIRIFTANNAVSDTSDSTFTIISTVGIERVASKKDFKVYPNPTNGKLTIESQGDDFEPTTTLRVFDLLGREVYNSNIVGAANSVDIDFTEAISKSGIYKLSIISGDEIHQQKLYINR